MSVASLFVTLDHLHSMPGNGVRPGWCHRGARQFCQRYGLDWPAIVAAGGIEAKRLLSLNDALADELVAHALRTSQSENLPCAGLPSGKNNGKHQDV
jgi:hypothetical protein